MILGVDIGTLHSVLATIQRGSVSIVRNELADRQTPTVVLFSDHQRLMGDHAVPLMRANAKNTCRGFKNILGEMFKGSTRVEKEVQLSYGNVTEAENGLAGFRVLYGGEERVFSAVRIMAAYLTKLRQVAEASTQRNVQEVVIACPSWYRDANRAALLDAAKIAGLNCLRVISDMSATALDYGLYRRLHFHETEAVNVAFIGIGHSSASVCVAAFTSNSMKILAEQSDPTIGGRDMDALIIKHYAESFEKQYSINPYNNLKARFKLEEQAEKVKKIVSANSEAVFHIECLVEDYDCSGILTRDAFEALCATELKPRLVHLLESCLQASGLNPAELSSVEITGGCTRIPWIQRCISDVFGKDVSKTLSADETVSRGCALQAAMASIHYKVKEYGFSERMGYPIRLAWTGGEGPIGNALEENTANNNEIIIPAGSNSNTSRRLTFQRSGPFQISLSYADLPQGSETAHIGTYNILLQSSPAPVDVHVLLTFNANGMIVINKVCTQEVKQIPKTAPEANAPPAAENAGDAENSGEKEPSDRPEVSEPAFEPQFVLHDVPFEASRYLAKVSEADIIAFAEAELNMDNDDRLHREKLEKLNALETFIYRFRDDISGKVSDFVAPGDKEKLLHALEEAENWIYDKQDDPTLHKSTVLKKTEEVESLGKEIYDREHEYHAIESASQKLMTLIQDIKTAVQGQDAQYAHILVEEKQRLYASADECANWVTTVISEYKAAPLYQNPLVRSDGILSRHKQLQALANEILSKPPPPKPAAPVSPAAEAPMDTEPPLSPAPESGASGPAEGMDS